MIVSVARVELFVNSDSHHVQFLRPTGCARIQGGDGRSSQSRVDIDVVVDVDVEESEVRDGDVDD